MFDLIKYEIQKHVDNDPNSELKLIGFFDTIRVSKNEYLKLQKEGWFFVRRHYMFITSFADWWNKFNINQKLTILAIAIPSAIAVLFGTLTLMNGQQDEPEPNSEAATLNLISISDSTDSLTLNFEEIKGKFKYQDLVYFKIDSLNWNQRTRFYEVIDLTTFYRIYQDTSLNYYGSKGRNPDLDFYFSIQQSSRETFEITTINQREGIYCDEIKYLIYAKTGTLIDSYVVARECGDGIYWSELFSRKTNDSTLLVTSRDNYKTPDTDNIDEPDIVTTEERTIQISKAGKFEELAMSVKTDTIPYN
jgi:hypothetical protein